MEFNIHDGRTIVTTAMTVIPNPILDRTTDEREGTLELDGDETAIKLVVIQVDGRDLVKDVEYELMTGKLIVKACALTDGKGVVRTVVEIVPEDNTQLSGTLELFYTAYVLVCLMVMHLLNGERERRYEGVMEKDLID